MPTLKSCVLATLAALTLASTPAFSAPTSDPLPTESLERLTRSFDLIKRFYVTDVTDEKLLEHALEGMVSGLDPHSDYLDPKAYKELNESTEGEFGGLGIEITKDSAGILVVAPIDDTPAQRAGLRAGDIITRIDGKSLASMSVSRAVKRMRGTPGTTIEVTIARKGEAKPLQITLTRALIKVQSVKMKPLKDGYGYIRISQFQSRTTEDLCKALNELAKTKNLKGLVLDLRGDPGGLLQAAIGVVAAFVPENSDVVSTQSRNEAETRTFRARPRDYRSENSVAAIRTLTPVAKTVPMVVLINSSSASASEIVAGALQDLKRATIMGDRSFGKGSVQTIFPLAINDDTVGVKITTARYYTPSGRSIQARGIEPDRYVDDTPEGNYPSFTIRESDLNRHLLNPSMSEEEEEEILESLPYSDNDSDTPKYTFTYGDEKDWQLQQALKELKGEAVTLSPYRGKPRSEVRKLREAEKAKKDKETSEKKTDDKKDATDKK